jgi:acetate kinase
MKILVLNSGSSSQKACLYEIGDTVPEAPPACLCEGKLEWERGRTVLVVKNSHTKIEQEHAKISRVDALERLLDTLWKGEARSITGGERVDVVGHRIVHGGPKYEEPVLITADVKSGIADVSAFAPLHNRADGFRLSKSCSVR